MLNTRDTARNRIRLHSEYCKGGAEDAGSEVSRGGNKADGSVFVASLSVRASLKIIITIIITIMDLYSARKHYMLSALVLYAIACLSVRPSICLSLCHTGGSVKTVEVRVMQFSPQNSPTIPLVLRYKFNTEILTASPERGRQTRARCEKQAIL